MDEIRKERDGSILAIDYRIFGYDGYREGGYVEYRFEKEEADKFLALLSQKEPHNDPLTVLKRLKEDEMTMLAETNFIRYVRTSRSE